jgi:hypothetical protein
MKRTLPNAVASQLTEKVYKPLIKELMRLAAKYGGKSLEIEQVFDDPPEGMNDWAAKFSFPSKSQGAKFGEAAEKLVHKKIKSIKRDAFILSGKIVEIGFSFVDEFSPKKGKVAISDVGTDAAASDAKIIAELVEAGYTDLAHELAEVTTAAWSQVVQTIVQQMGGPGRLRVMLGAQVVQIDNKTVGITFPNKTRSKGNHVEVKLLPSDTYKMEFFNVSVKGKKLVKKYTDVYNDQLVDLFEKQTGWYLRL